MYQLITYLSNVCLSPRDRHSIHNALIVIYICDNNMACLPRAWIGAHLSHGTHGRTRIFNLNNYVIHVNP